MHSGSSCSTSASWPSSHGVGCEVLIGREAISCQPPRLRTRNLHPYPFLIVENLEKRVFFFGRRHHHVPFLIHSLSLSRGINKLIHNLERSVAPVGVSVLYEAVGADDLTVSSTYDTPSSSNLNSHFLAGSPSESRIRVREQIPVVPTVKWRQWTSVEEAVRAIVVHFLESRGLSAILSAIAVKKAPNFITYLLSLLQSCYPTRYLSGKELVGREIKCVVLPYLASLGIGPMKDADGIVSDSPSLPSVPDLESFVPRAGITSRILSGYPVLRGYLVDGKLPPSLSYCLSIGLSPAQVEITVKKFPPIVGYSVEGRMEKVVDFFLSSLDVPSSLIRLILIKGPQLFGCNVEENLRPTVTFLESLGVERERWGRILVSFPRVLTYSCTKSALVFNFLLEIGVSRVGAGKVLSRFPHAVGYSVEVKLKPMAAYFHSIGIQDFSRLISRSPQTLGLSLEGNIKPTVYFFSSSLGLSTEEIVLVVKRFPQILGLNVEHNLRPKWEFFQGMNRHIIELVEFPQYFGYSLEKRILPRYNIVVEKRITWKLNRMLSSTGEVFQRLTNT